jgi:hypothetical protein
MEFLRRVDKHKDKTHNFRQMVDETFARTERQFLDMEILYDEKTEHRLNVREQEEWFSMLHKRL